ncbi:MAG: DUF5103 domain-containing protein, partial [Pedobacter sp.]
VECYNSKKEQSPPVIALNGEQLIFSFDDLGPANQDYSYTIEHCTSDWKPSRINTLDYLKSFSEDRLIDYRISFNTIQKYTHYELKLPNDQIAPKIAGNYLLKVYEDGNMQKPVISQRIYITNNTVNVGTEIVPSSQVPDRQRNQKVNFTIFHSMPIANPYLDLKAVVMQNFDPLTSKLNTKPSFIRQGSLVYNDLTTNDFAGLSEYRKFDFRSLKFKGEGVSEIYRDSVNSVVLYRDQVNKTPRYTNQFDENGSFFIRNNDGRDNRTEADYASVFFSLNSMPPYPDGSLYVVGRFNNYSLNNENRLNYVEDRKTFFGSLLLKQGLYDYRYVWVGADGKVYPAEFEGSYFETENTYQVLVYYKRPGARWEELVGYTNVNSVKR